MSNPLRILSLTEKAILRAILDAGGGAYGIAIRQCVEASLGHLVTVCTLTSTLDQLEREGMVQISEIVQERPGGGTLTRRYYRAAGDLAIRLSD